MPEGGALEKALQELVRQAVNSLRQELRGLVSSGSASPSAQPVASVSAFPAVSQGISRILQPTVQGYIDKTRENYQKRFGQSPRCVLRLFPFRVSGQTGWQ